MAMKFARAHCEQIGKSLSPYRARDLYTDEDGEYFGRELTFLCEDHHCRALLTPVGIYMTRRSKRAVHFRTRDEHTANCGFLQLDSTAKKTRGHKPSEIEDDFKLTFFPDELVLSPRQNSRSSIDADIDASDDNHISSGRSSESNDKDRRQTHSRTRYLDLIVDCFLYGDERSKEKPFTIDKKTKPFKYFFKKIQYFKDEEGLIYYGEIKDLRLYKDEGVGLFFTKRTYIEAKSYRVWVYIPQEEIDASSRKKSFLAEIAELKKAIDSGEEVVAFFVGAYPVKITLQNKESEYYDIYRAKLSSVDHLSLRFAK